MLGAIFVSIGSRTSTGPVCAMGGTPKTLTTMEDSCLLRTIGTESVSLTSMLQRSVGWCQVLQYLFAERGTILLALSCVELLVENSHAQYDSHVTGFRGFARKKSMCQQCWNTDNQPQAVVSWLLKSF